VFEKGTVAAMTSALFCDECGAALPAQATSCAVCRHYFVPSSPAPPAQAAGASLLPTPAASVGTLRRGMLFAQRYRILDKVGEGGFGITYKAEDLDHHRWLVAIKQINLSQLSPQQVIEATDSFNREVGYLSRLKHDDIPRIYDYFTDPGHWYVVMDYIAGETLENKLKKAHRGRFPTQQVFDIGMALCDVLGYLHAQRPPIVFRDVKPANIMLTKSGRIYLIDFGIARYYAPGQSRDTAPLGSPAYAAPEQYGKAQTTMQTDIYGLGATLQTLLTGKDPLEIAVSGEKQGRKIKRRVPRKLRPLLEQMLERDASKRPQSMDEVKQSLHWLKEHSAGHRVQRTLPFLWDFLTHSAIRVMLFVALLLLIYFIFFFTGFFNSPFWIPCLLLMLCVVVGRSAYYLRQVREETTTRLNAKEALSIVLKHLKGSILYALIPAALCYFFYDILRPDSPLSIDDFLFLGGIILFFIICGLFLFNKEVGWLLHRVTSRWRSRKPGQAPPLQQQMRKRP
jgi:succinate dehydrogenase hydrophobic anchor subunit